MKEKAIKLIELGDEVMYVGDNSNDLLKDYPDAFRNGICTTQQLEKLELVAVVRKIVADVFDDLDTLIENGAEYLITESDTDVDEEVGIKSLKDFNQILLNIIMRKSGNTGSKRYWTLDRKRTLKLHRPSQRPRSIPPDARPSL